MIAKALVKKERKRATFLFVQKTFSPTKYVLDRCLKNIKGRTATQSPWEANPPASPQGRRPVAVYYPLGYPTPYGLVR
jgi:hypothetical protein